MRVWGCKIRSRHTLRHNSGNRGHTANKAVCPLAKHANRIIYIFQLFLNNKMGSLNIFDCLFISKENNSWILADFEL